MRHQPQYDIPYPEPTFPKHGGFDLSLLRDTQKQWECSSLFAAATKNIGERQAIEQHLLYNFGVSRWRGGASALFLSNSAHPEFHTAIIQQFDPHTGLSLDNDFVYLHDLYKDNFGIDVGQVDTHILLGTHLTFRYPSKPIVIVRHPIDLLIASACIEDFVFLGTGDFDFVELSKPCYTDSLPGSAPIILLTEEKDEAHWSEAAVRLNTIYAPNGRGVSCMNASTLPHYNGSLATLFLNYSHDVKTLIQNL
jgi:hypothetical protein